MIHTRDEIVDMRRRHNPRHQEGNGYDRCALCDYTRHPCDVHDLCTDWLELHDATTEDDTEPVMPRGRIIGRLVRE